MSSFVSKLLSDRLTESKIDLDKTLRSLVQEKLNQLKIRIAAEMYEEVGLEVDFVVEELEESVKNITKAGRTKVVRVRVRGGKIQRRKKMSAIPGYTIRNGKVIKMTVQERRHRKMAARRAKFKRRAKLRQSLRKRKMSLRKRRSMGL